MKREIKFSLVFRDMWQSAGKYVPRVDQLTRVAPAIIEMGCFDRVETNGGGFEQVNLLFGENPNKAVREWTKPFNEAGIQTHMLDRALNGLRMSPVPDDVRQLFYTVKKAQGTDIARTFCGLNDVQNIAPSIKYAKEAGMISQCSLSITHSPIHTVEYYTKMAIELIELGADEICIKDMAGIGRPHSLGLIVKNIKAKYPEIPIQYHSHAGPGFNVASILEVCDAGCDYIDVGMEPLSWGTGHADLLTVHAMLKDAGYKVPDINMEAYMKVRSMVQEFMDDFLGLYISPKNRLMNSLLIGPGLPGGMMGSLMSDLEKNLESINKSNIKNNKPLMSEDQLLIKLFDEVAYVWPRVGYPPLVTPFSQYVKNLAMMNVMQLEKGKARWSMIADDIWDMILGKAGRLPGKLAPEIIEKAKLEGREFFEGNPQDNYPDALNKYRKLMNEKQWEMGEDDEELFEYAMHPAQYEAYRSGKAKVEFLADVAKRKAEQNVPAAEAQPAAQSQAASFALPTTPQVMSVDVNGQKYQVTVDFGNTSSAAAPAASAPVAAQPAAAPAASNSAGGGEEVLSPLEGKFFLVKGTSDTPLKVGDTVKEGDVLCYIEAMKTYNAVRSEFSGTITSILPAPGDTVAEDDVLMTIG
ncbi:pyruvate carboxylase subunit B [Parabacteroides sp. PF5-5]|uniref:biotin/lipoyl-containing protein n=1 Tax=unclassified Parabacteroides TaxID=2649774 RepID=UPI002474168E|nr:MULTISPECIES: biotin/lipoyl-containing protein [unclassified Parabacteroides]MDH6304963.1 pyruvate carboxylase subunit B [Parabacteroides sp. PH5-39]MDH6315951.1 pyruvate carboxylase subunit B [Parabacteroides sp. PF5-13]MDH6319608.1 pyruvate carboxylase subunit B [Parabacteroides sp. PH5-13]MDH6323339.1 pyruvate carboxylase subunit B [Parabacteroides sp. PH5-8]MDH6327152.1 pyruvate carboxylase subunit B [Parabacteroides sp. PH5-41]